jgi:hypothetical protein
MMQVSGRDGPEASPLVQLILKGDRSPSPVLPGVERLLQYCMYEGNPLNGDHTNKQTYQY